MLRLRNGKKLTSYLLILVSFTGLLLGAKPQNNLRTEISAQLGGSLIYATNEELRKTKIQLTKDNYNIFKNDERFAFKNFYPIGTDVAEIYRVHENWLKPLSPSEIIKIRFSLRYHKDNSMRLNLAFWNGENKMFIVETSLIEHNEPLYIIGPPWRSGVLILKLEVLPR